MANNLAFVFSDELPIRKPVDLRHEGVAGILFALAINARREALKAGDIIRRCIADDQFCFAIAHGEGMSLEG